MKLYYSPGACSLASHIVLEELGISYESQKMSFDKGDTNQPEFLSLNPMGAVPVLQLDDGKAITENSAILQYLADLKPELGLAPKYGTFERTRFLEALGFVNSELHKGFGPLFGIDYQTKDPIMQPKLIKYWTQELSERLDVLVKKIGDKPYILETGFSVVDIYAFVVLNWAKYVDVELSKWPKLVEYCGRIKERPATLRALNAEGLLK